MKKLIGLFLVLLSVCGCMSCSHNKTTGYDFMPLDTLIQSWMDKEYYPGGAVCVAKNDTEWRELIDETTGEAYQISSPGWAGAYPWINKRDSVYGFFIAHVTGSSQKEDGFSSFYGSPVISATVTQILNR